MDNEAVLKTAKRLKIEIYHKKKHSSAVNLRFCNKKYRNMILGLKQSFSSRNKIGFLKTRKQPSGSNAYFNILKQKREIANISSPLRKAFSNACSPARISLIPSHLSCAACTCETVCTCGRRLITKPTRDVFDGIQKNLNTLEISNKGLKDKFRNDVGFIRKNIRSCKTVLGLKYRY